MFDVYFQVEMRMLLPVWFTVILATDVFASFQFENEIEFDYSGTLGPSNEDLLAAEFEPLVIAKRPKKASLVHRAKKAPSVVLRGGSALGSLPQAEDVEKPTEDFPLIDIAVGKDISVAGYGKISIVSLIYDEAEESKLYVGIHHDGKEEPRQVVVKVFTPKRKGDFGEIKQEIEALRALADVKQVIKLLHADGLVYKNPKKKQVMFCVLEWLHSSLVDLLDHRFHGSLPVNLIKRIAYDAITAFEAIHSKHFVHGDVGIGNLMFDDEALTNLKVIDFGYGRKYMIDGEHVAAGHCPLPAFSRTLLSLSELDEQFPSRRDDLFRLGEVLLKLLNTDYSRLFTSSVVENIRKIKLKTVPTKCCTGATDAFDEYFRQVRGLGYTDDPDYEALRRLFA
jgi:serine/threonine protein kinase